MSSTLESKEPHGNVTSDGGYEAEKQPEVETKTTSLSDSNASDLVVFETPDPTDTRNPQNWSRTKKNLVFVALMSSSILADG